MKLFITVIAIFCSSISWAQSACHIDFSILTNQTWVFDQVYLDSIRVYRSWMEDCEWTFYPDGTVEMLDSGLIYNAYYKNNANSKSINISRDPNATSPDEKWLLVYLTNKYLVYRISTLDDNNGVPLSVEVRLKAKP